MDFAVPFLESDAAAASRKERRSQFRGSSGAPTSQKERHAHFPKKQ